MRRHLFLLIPALLCATGTDLHAQPGFVWTRTQKLTASDGDEADAFGYSVALSGDRALVGANRNEGTGAAAHSAVGSAYVFEPQENGVWKQVAELTSPNTMLLGASVALDGERALVGAFREDGSGAAYVFERQANGTWSEVAQLSLDQHPHAGLGFSVSLDGERALVGAVFDDGVSQESGAAYVFDRSADGAWQRTAKLIASDGESMDLFGYSVSLSGDDALVGARKHSGRGEAYFYARDASGNWIQTKKVEPGGNEHPVVATSVSLRHNRALVKWGLGARIFERNATGVWQYTATLTIDPESVEHIVGAGVSLGENRAVVGVWTHDTDGHTVSGAHVFDQQPDGRSWSDTAQIACKSSYAFVPLSVSGDRILVGTAGEKNHAGSAFIFDRHRCVPDRPLPPATGGDFAERQKLTADDGASGDEYARTLALEEEWALVGAQDYDLPLDPNDRDQGENRGAVYAFRRQPDGVWLQSQKLAPADARDDDHFGCSVALSAGRALVGAWGSSDVYQGLYARGAAYVFERQSDGVWREAARLIPSDGATQDTFGWTVALSGDLAVIQSRPVLPGPDRYLAPGKVYLFERQGDGMWLEKTILTPDDGIAGDQFGAALAAGNDLIVVGAPTSPRTTGVYSGAVYVFERQSDGSWLQTARLVDAGGASGEYFGSSVALSSTGILAGVPFDDPHGSRSGSVFVIERGVAQPWHITQQLTASDGAAEDIFGFRLAVAGDTALISAEHDDGAGRASGTVYLFKRQAGGNWVQQTKLAPGDPAEGKVFGSDVALSPQFALIGAVGDSSDRGAAYLFERQGEFLFTKDVIAGPNRDGDCVTDRVVEVHSRTPSEFQFRITLRAPNLPSPMISDLVPSGWKVVDCTPSNSNDFLLLTPEGRPEHGHRATRIEWFPTDSSGYLLCTVRTRAHGPEFEPLECGDFPLNAGAAALDSATREPLLDPDGNPMKTAPLCVAAIRDMQHDGIDYSGNGDEDGDGLTDYEEACVRGTNPCDRDTDHDGVNDAVDRDPLDRHVR